MTTSIRFHHMRRGKAPLSFYCSFIIASGRGKVKAGFFAALADCGDGFAVFGLIGQDRRLGLVQAGEAAAENVLIDLNAGVHAVYMGENGVKRLRAVYIKLQKLPVLRADIGITRCV